MPLRPAHALPTPPSSHAGAPESSFRALNFERLLSSSLINFESFRLKYHLILFALVLNAQIFAKSVMCFTRCGVVLLEDLVVSYIWSTVMPVYIVGYKYGSHI